MNPDYEAAHGLISVDEYDQLSTPEDCMDMACKCAIAFLVILALLLFGLPIYFYF